MRKPSAFERLLPVVLIVNALVAFACSAPPAAPPVEGRVAPTYDQKGKLQQLTYDRDGDGKIDMWAFMDGAVVVRTEVDEDHDGKVDRWEYHGASACEGAGCSSSVTAGAQGDQTIGRIDRATHHDGKVNRREFFENGRLQRVEEDTDGDGRLDKWETYKNGGLATMDIDTTHRGKPDRRLLYDADGSFLRMEADKTGSGTFTPLKP